MKTPPLNHLPNALLMGATLAVVPGRPAAKPANEATTLQAVRKGHVTRIVKTRREEKPLGKPASPAFRAVEYPGPVGPLAGWISGPISEDAKAKQPAIIWLTGGWPVGGVGKSAWEPQEIENDQSAKVYRHAGIVTLYPTFRGANGNPGAQELYYGEVDDLLAALAFLKTVPYVDPDRIYLGGHSSGGTLALLGAAASADFRAVIALGPASLATMIEYVSDDGLPFDPKDAREVELRDPARYLNMIRSPLWVIEGSYGSTEALRAFQAATTHPKARFFEVPAVDHFSVVAPVNALLARRIAQARPDQPFAVSAAELETLGHAQARALRKVDDLDTLAALARYGASLAGPREANFYVFYWNGRKALEAAAKDAKARGYRPGKIEAEHRGENVRYLLPLHRTVSFQDVEAVLEASEAVRVFAREHKAGYLGWDTAL